MRPALTTSNLSKNENFRHAVLLSQFQKLKKRKTYFHFPSPLPRRLSTAGLSFGGPLLWRPRPVITKSCWPECINIQRYARIYQEYTENILKYAKIYWDVQGYTEMQCDTFAMWFNESFLQHLQGFLDVQTMEIDSVPVSPSVSKNRSRAKNRPRGLSFQITSSCKSFQLLSCWPHSSFQYACDPAGNIIKIIIINSINNWIPMHLLVSPHVYVVILLMSYINTCTCIQLARLFEIMIHKQWLYLWINSSSNRAGSVYLDTILLLYLFSIMHSYFSLLLCSSFGSFLKSFSSQLSMNSCFSS